MGSKYHDWLAELTLLPTAAGCEHRVIDWVRDWAQQQPMLRLTEDRFGNLVLQRRGRLTQRPIVFEAHLDHPAFVVTAQLDDRELSADFRGGVDLRFFDHAKVLLHTEDGSVVRGRVTSVTPADDQHPDKRVTIALQRAASANKGDILTWDTGPQRIAGDRIHTPACDNLASVAAALSALHAMTEQGIDAFGDVRVLLTRAEEVGFIGAIAAAKHRTIPAGSRVIVLENSKSFAESPIGGGPILRVGDRTSTFDPDLTYRLGCIADLCSEEDADFTWQRKLMTGGTCNASAYHAFGYTSACLCLPLGNYHNMNETTGRIAAETISLSDYDGLVRWLVATAGHLDDGVSAPALRQQLEARFATRRDLLA
jgi:putative aminopeptidase FrvX